MMHYFDGSSYLYNTSFNNALINSYTVSLWFTTTSTVADITLLLLGLHANPVCKIRLNELNNYQTSAEFTLNDSRTIYSNNRYTTNNIHHLFVKQSTGGIFHMYLNGVMADTGAVFGTQSTTYPNLYIGSSQGVWNFTGGISDIAIWNKPLPLETCHLLLRGKSPINIHRDALVDYFPLGTDGHCYTNGVKGTQLTLSGNTSWISASKPISTLRQRKFTYGTVYVPPLPPQYPLFLEDTCILP